MAFCYAGASVLLLGLINPEFSPIVFFQNDGGPVRVGLVVVSIVTGLYFQNLYANFRVSSLTILIQQFCMAIGGSFLIQALLTYLKRPEWAIPKWMMIFGSVLALVLIPGWRLLYSTIVVKALTKRRVLFLGTSNTIREIATHLDSHAELGMSIIGFVDNGQDPGDLPGGRILGGSRNCVVWRSGSSRIWWSWV